MNIYRNFLVNYFGKWSRERSRRRRRCEDNIKLVLTEIRCKNGRKIKVTPGQVCWRYTRNDTGGVDILRCPFGETLTH
jgi:hypothetical protein